MDFKKQKPIFRQISDLMADQVLEGIYPPDGRLPSVREVAATLGVNPNTAVRAYEILAADGIIYNRRGMGYYVATDARQRVLEARRKEFMDDELPALRLRLQQLGITIDDIKEQLTY